MKQTTLIPPRALSNSNACQAGHDDDDDDGYATNAPAINDVGRAAYGICYDISVDEAMNMDVDDIAKYLEGLKPDIEMYYDGDGEPDSVYYEEKTAAYIIATLDFDTECIHLTRKIQALPLAVQQDDGKLLKALKEMQETGDDTDEVYTGLTINGGDSITDDHFSWVSIVINDQRYLVLSISSNGYSTHSYSRAWAFTIDIEDEECVPTPREIRVNCSNNCWYCYQDDGSHSFSDITINYPVVGFAAYPRYKMGCRPKSLDEFTPEHERDVELVVAGDKTDGSDFGDARTRIKQREMMWVNAYLPKHGVVPAKKNGKDEDVCSVCGAPVEFTQEY